jgi:hypothetical protein
MKGRGGTQKARTPALPALNNMLQGVIGVFALTMIVASAFARGPDPPGSFYSIEEAQVEYCAGDQDLAIARIHVSLRFLNRSKTNMILSRLFYPRPDIRIIDPSGAKVWPTDTYELAHGDIGEAPDVTQFEIIKPHESTLREFVVRVFVARNSLHPVRSTFVGGTYFISAKLSTWPFYSDTRRARRARTLRERYGTLVISGVKIENLRVQISIPEKLELCGHSR